MEQSDYLPEHLQYLASKHPQDALLSVANENSLISTLAALDARKNFYCCPPSHCSSELKTTRDRQVANIFDCWLPSHCRFRLEALRDLQVVALLLCLGYWQASPDELNKFTNCDTVPEGCPDSIVNKLPSFKTRNSMLQMLYPPRVCRLSVPCGGGKTAIIAWLCALRGGNIFIGTDNSQNAMHILFVLLKETNLASYMNVKIVRGTDECKQLNTSGLSDDDARLLEQHTIKIYDGDVDFEKPLVPDNGIGNIVIVDAYSIRLKNDSSIREKLALRAALSLMIWTLMIFDEADRFFTPETRTPFETGFDYNGGHLATRHMKFNVPDAVMLSGTWREGDDSNTTFKDGQVNMCGRDWLKMCGPMLLRIRSYDLAKLGILATLHYHLVICKDVPDDKFGFPIPQIRRTHTHKEFFQFGLTFSMMHVIEKIIQMHSLTKGKVMIFSSLENETKALSAMFPKAMVVTGSTEQGEKTTSFKYFNSKSSGELDTRNLWITTSIGGRGTDVPEVKAIILIGGEATDTKWQQIGRGLRAWAGSRVCDVYDLASEQVKWANDWLKSPNRDNFLKDWLKDDKKNRLKNVVLEGFEDYINIMDSEDCILNIEKEIGRICDETDRERVELPCCTDDPFVAANHAACIALDDFSKFSVLPTQKEKQKAPKPKTTNTEHLLQKRHKHGKQGFALPVKQKVPPRKRQKQGSDAGSSAVASTQEPIRNILRSLVDVESSTNVYPVDRDTLTDDMLLSFREDLRKRAANAAKKASETLQARIQDIWMANNFEHPVCKFMADKFEEL
jgi:hypothetical protein